MSCTDWRTRLDAYVDTELPQREMEEFRAHLAHCTECAAATLALIEAKGALRRAGQRYTASSELRARVLATAQANVATQSSPKLKPAPQKTNVISWPRWVLAAAALFLLTAGLFFFAVRNRQPSSLNEFADLHIATLASANPVEVVSTDRHTVKPWFQGRVPFTFDLPELQGTPFTLTGGRVTYFHQEPGAHLIFAYQKHFISVFIFRDTPELAIRQASFSDRGTSFNLQSWKQNGLRYVLVSDVSVATLQQLANLLGQHS